MNLIRDWTILLVNLCMRVGSPRAKLLIPPRLLTRSVVSCMTEKRDTWRTTLCGCCWLALLLLSGGEGADDPGGFHEEGLERVWVAASTPAGRGLLARGGSPPVFTSPSSSCWTGCQGNNEAERLPPPSLPAVAGAVIITPTAAAGGETPPGDDDSLRLNLQFPSKKKTMKKKRFTWSPMVFCVLRFPWALSINQREEMGEVNTVRAQGFVRLLPFGEVAGDEGRGSTAPGDDGAALTPDMRNRTIRRIEVLRSCRPSESLEMAAAPGAVVSSTCSRQGGIVPLRQLRAQAHPGTG